MARNFSCGWILEICTGDLSGTYNGYIPVGATVEYSTMILQTCMNTCYGDPVGGGYANYYDWYSDRTSIANIAGSDGSGNVQVSGVGE
jgi:hypothetical protein